MIYHNIFDRCNIILRLFSNDDTQEWANPAFNQLAYGTEDNLYFEDNTIMYSSSYGGDNPGWIETGQGGRLVARYNTWNLANATTPQDRHQHDDRRVLRQYAIEHGHLPLGQSSRQPGTVL